MKFVYLMILLAMVASAAAAPLALIENENTEIDSSASLEDSNENLSGENSSAIQRRSINLVFWKRPGISPFKSLVPCGAYSFHRHHGHDHHRHSHHHHNHHGHHQHPTEPSLIATNTPRPTAVKTTLAIDTNTSIRPTIPTTIIATTKLITPTVPTTLRPTTAAATTTTIIQTKPSTTASTTMTTISTTTRTTTVQPDAITSTATPRYNDPDNELIYDIDLRFRS